MIQGNKQDYNSFSEHHFFMHKLLPMAPSRDKNVHRLEEVEDDVTFQDGINCKRRRVVVTPPPTPPPVMGCGQHFLTTQQQQQFCAQQQQQQQHAQQQHAQQQHAQLQHAQSIHCQQHYDVMSSPWG